MESSGEKEGEKTMSEDDIYLYAVVSDNYAGTWQGESYFPTEKLDEADFVIRVNRKTHSGEIIKNRYGAVGKISDQAFWREAYEKGRQDCRNEIRDANIEVVNAIENLVTRLAGAP